MDFKKEAEDIKELLIALRRDFHQNPELGFFEYETSNKIKKFLKEEGISYKEVAKTGIYAVIKGNGNRTIALRADMDALPLEDKKSCEYKSKVKGKMHACGHDAHTTILLGTAKILNRHKDKLKGNVVLLFEPAEETTGGALPMIDEGVLDDLHVDGVCGLHVQEWLKCGEIGIKSGVVNAASNPFTINIWGKGGHGASPSDTIDPIVISSNIVLALQTIVSRELPPQDAAVITIGTFNGGTAQNIIPEKVTLSGIIRTMKSEHREYVKKRLKEVVEGIAIAMRGKATIDIEESYPCLYNNDEMVKLLKDTSISVVGNERTIILEKPSMGVESFAYFSLKRPSVFYYLGCGNKDKGIINPAHGSLFDIDEDCLPVGVSMQCNIAYNFLNDEN